MLVAIGGASIFGNTGCDVAARSAAIALRNACSPSFGTRGWFRPSASAIPISHSVLSLSPVAAGFQPSPCGCGTLAPAAPTIPA